MSTIEETRAIVESAETYEGAIIPTRRAEIDREVTIHDDAEVTEGVYGETVLAEAEATVEGPVMASESVELDGATVTADVGSSGRILGTDARVHGSVTGTRIRLRDCVVLGNVVAQELILENCLVLGVVTGTRRLDLTASTVYTFNSHAEATVEDVDVLLPQAVVDGELTLETPVRVLPFQPGEDAEVIQLTRDDLQEHDGTRYLTLAPRLLDISRVEEKLDAIEELLRDPIEDIHSDTEAATGYDRSWLATALGLDPEMLLREETDAEGRD